MTEMVIAAADAGFFYWYETGSGEFSRFDPDPLGIGSTFSGGRFHLHSADPRWLNEHSYDDPAYDVWATLGPQGFSQTSSEDGVLQVVGTELTRLENGQMIPIGAVTVPELYVSAGRHENGGVYVGQGESSSWIANIGFALRDYASANGLRFEGSNVEDYFDLSIWHDNILAGATINGHGGNDRLRGTDAIDEIFGGPGDDVIDAEDGADLVEGGTGADEIDGGDGDDWLYGMSVDGDGLSQAETGDVGDYIRGGDGDDHIRGNQGDDELWGNDGSDHLYGGKQNDLVVGGDGNDWLYGDGPPEVISDEAGDDELSGGDGDDRLWGGPGDDILRGGDGNDFMDGGEDIDTAVYEDRRNTYTLTPTAAGFEVSDGIYVDTLTNIEFIQFRDETISLFNSEPVVQIDDQTIHLDEYAWKRLDGVLSVTDPDNDTITQYELWDSEGGDNWWADGGTVDASGGYVTSDLSGIWFQRDGAPSIQTLWVRAYDGEDWSAWKSFRLDTVGNSAPVADVEDQTIESLTWRRLSDVLDFTDVDGDALQSVNLWDSEGDDNWWADGAIVDASGGYETSNPNGVWFQGDPSSGSQTLWVQASDGEDWSTWNSFTLTTVEPNTPPVVAVDDQTIDLNEYAWRRLDSVLSVTDPDNDTIAQYELWDGEGGDNWWADGGMVDASDGYVTSDLSSIWFQRDNEPSEQTLWVRAYDGEDWSGWDAFQLITA